MENVLSVREIPSVAKANNVARAHVSQANVARPPIAQAAKCAPMASASRALRTDNVELERNVAMARAKPLNVASMPTVPQAVVSQAHASVAPRKTSVEPTACAAMAHVCKGIAVMLHNVAVAHAWATVALPAMAAIPPACCQAEELEPVAMELASLVHAAATLTVRRDKSARTAPVGGAQRIQNAVLV